MKLSVAILGTSTVEKLTHRRTEAILKIGKDAFTRADLSSIECWNFVAAANLSMLLAEELNVVDTKDLYDRIPPSALAIPRLGAISLAVLGAAFEAKKLGGETPLQTWVERHQVKDTPSMMVTFTSLKKREAKLTAVEKKTAALRKSSRRFKAHKFRVARFTDRSRRMSA